jgi:D-lactate dehydrogenase
VGDDGLRWITKTISKVAPGFPQWHRGLSSDYGRPDMELSSSFEDAEFIYWPTCMSRMMGGTADVLMRVASKADANVHIPRNASGKCCGQAFSSKGYVNVAIEKQSELLDAIWEWSRHGERPVVLDLGSCTSFLKTGLPYLDAVRKERLSRIQVLDSLELAAKFVPSLQITRKISDVAVHSVCSNHKFGLEAPLMQVANACADRVHSPHEGKCCGMGGDRGFEIPDFALSATKNVAESMQQSKCETGYTNARSCALSLSSSSEKPWRSIFHLLDECTE